MPDKIINHVVIDEQPGKFYAPNVLTGLEETDEITELKENLSGLETDGVAPSAEQILSDNVTVNSVPYHFRKTASDNADREELEIVGGSVAWNQLITFAAGAITNNGIRIEKKGDGSIAVTGTATANTTIDIKEINLFKDHVYVLTGCPQDGAVDKYALYANQTNPQLFDTGNGSVKKQVTDVIGIFYAIVYSGQTVDLTFVPQLFDLTQMFGSTIADYVYTLETATAGAGVALFKSLFPKDYYAYDAGSIQSVSGLSEHKMVGFNQWDEDWELGSLSQGQPVESNTNIRTKNFCSILPNTSYCAVFPSSTSTMYLAEYDEAKNFLGYSSNSFTTSPKVFTTKANTKYFKFVMSTTYGTTYNHDICINLSDTAKNGTYEPYKAHSYPLDSTLTLRGIPKLVDGKMCFDGDTYDADGTVTRRYGIVDLGTLTWTYDGVFSAIVPSIAKNKYTSQNLVCSKYPTTPLPLSQFTYGIRYTGNASSVMVKDSAYTDATTFKAAMSGVYLVYELETPTTEEADPYKQLQICDPNGTEEFVSTGIVPVGHNTQYPENLKAKIEGLPWNFANLIAPTESAFVATRNYTTGSLFIVNNILYKATSNIANGNTITPNTNCAATTLAEIISALA